MQIYHISDQIRSYIRYMHNQVASVIIFQTENFSGRRHWNQLLPQLKFVLDFWDFLHGYMHEIRDILKLCGMVSFSFQNHKLNLSVSTVTLDAALVMATALVRSNYISDISRLELFECEDTFCSIISSSKWSYFDNQGWGWACQGRLPGAEGGKCRSLDSDFITVSSMQWLYTLAT